LNTTETEWKNFCRKGRQTRKMLVYLFYLRVFGVFGGQVLAFTGKKKFAAKYAKPAKLKPAPTTFAYLAYFAASF
jgi:hypothetical protein